MKNINTNGGKIFEGLWFGNKCEEKSNNEVEKFLKREA